MWINLIRKGDVENKKNVSKALLFGLIAAIPILGFQYFWLENSNLQLYNKIGGAQSTMLFTVIFAGALSELAKFLLLINLKWLKIEIKNINQAIVLILASALGFAYIENIIFFLKITNSGEFYSHYSNFVWRSLLVTAAHMLFGGVIAYYYSIGKLGNPIVAMENSMGERHPMNQLLKKIFKLKASTIFRVNNVLFGLLLAIIFHAGFNSVLESNNLGTALLIVFIAFLFLLYLSQKRTSYLVFTPAEEAKIAKISKKEKDVVIELMGKWIKEEKYYEIIGVCDRLLIKYPGNSLIKLVKAKAADKRRIQRLKNIAKRLFTTKGADSEGLAGKYENQSTASIKKKKVKKKTTLGLVLGGGGIRGCLHLGFYQVLKENGIEVDYIAGTSMGAMIGAALALGQDIDVIKGKILAQRDLKLSWEDFNYFNESIIKHDFLKYGVQLLCEGKSFRDLKTPFACVAVNLENGEEVMFTDGDLEPAVAASASLPMIFPPIYYRDKYLVDGGIKNNLPSAACKKLGADKIIAISINNYTVQQNIAGQVFAKYNKMGNTIKKNKKGLPSNLLSKKKYDLNLFLDIFMQVISIASQCCNQSGLKKAKPDLLIEVNCNLGLFEFGKVDEAIEIGRKAALDNLDKIKALIVEK